MEGEKIKYSFPINKKIINNYPNLKKSFNKNLSKEFSPKQIFRLLDNLHYNSIKTLVEFLERCLSDDKYNQFVTQKLNTNDNIIFLNNIREIFILDYLLKKGYNVYTFDNNKTNKPVPEYYIKNSFAEMLIELYSPYELYGFQIFWDELLTAIKYFPNDLGFKCIMNIKYDKKEEDWIKRNIIPFEINYKYGNDKLRHKYIQNILDSLFNNIDNKLGKSKFYITDDVYISFCIRFNNNYNNRLIIHSTPNYDSVSNYVSLKSNSNGFYKKLLHKIKSGQLNIGGYPSALKILFIDFSYSMGSDVLVEGMGKDHFSKLFYENLTQQLTKDVSVKSVDLIFPVICKLNNNFLIGKCIFNPQNINIQKLFIAN